MLYSFLYIYYLFKFEYILIILWSVILGPTIVCIMFCEFLVITKSKVLPLLWVGSIICYFRFQSFSIFLKINELGF